MPHKCRRFCGRPPSQALLASLALLGGATFGAAQVRGFSLSRPSSNLLQQPRRESARNARPLEASEEEVEALPQTHNLQEAVEEVLFRLLIRRPQTHENITDHELPPLVPKQLWESLGSFSRAQEEYCGQLPTDQWISLRLDGCSWGTLMDRLKKSEVLPLGFNEDIGRAMTESCRAVMCEFGAVLGFTHSDELTVLVPPSRERAYDGDVRVWLSAAASVATSVFNRRLARLAARAQKELDDVILATFDCRVGVYPTALQASSLLLWRAQDCSVNSASDAIKFAAAPMRVRSFNTIQKLSYLQAHGLLPLRRHQCHGSLLMQIHDSGGGSRVALVNDGSDGRPKSLLNLARVGPLVPATALTDTDRQDLDRIWNKARAEEPAIPFWQPLLEPPEGYQGQWPYSRPQCREVSPDAPEPEYSDSDPLAPG